MQYIPTVQCFLYSEKSMQSTQYACRHCKRKPTNLVDCQKGCQRRLHQTHPLVISRRLARGHRVTCVRRYRPSNRLENTGSRQHTFSPPLKPTIVQVCDPLDPHTLACPVGGAIYQVEEMGYDVEIRGQLTFRPSSVEVTWRPNLAAAVRTGDAAASSRKAPSTLAALSRGTTSALRNVPHCLCLVTHHQQKLY